MSNYAVLYYLLLSFLLLSTYFFITRAFQDERSRVRLSYQMQRVQKRSRQAMKSLESPKIDNIFRKVGLPSWLNSRKFNICRTVILFILAITMVMKYLLHIHEISQITVILLATTLVTLEPRKPFPLYYLLNQLRERYNVSKNTEVYQLYNEIHSEFVTKGEHIGNMYHFIKELRPYYDVLQSTIDKILPELRESKHERAWDIFSKEVGTDEALSLSLIMKEVENASLSEAVEILENKQQEFSNAIYNNYVDYLRRRKNIFFVFVSAGSLSVIMNPVVAFVLWYQDVMSVVNQMH